MSDPQIAINFLEQLRPGGPWVLTAIIPDGKTYTITTTNVNEVSDFVNGNDGNRNLYYSQPDAERNDQKSSQDRHRCDRIFSS
jgi:hypothetical protein